MRKVYLMLIVGLGLSACVMAGEELTYVDLIHRLTDLEQLAVLPAVGETCQQWSSYDRASKYDPVSGTYLGWDANGDNFGIIRAENGKQVFAEMKGPGVIWRIWSAKTDPGHVRIYLDGAAEPVVDLPFEEYFNRQNEPFTPSSLVHITSSGKNSYIPIPYQKSCKIVADEGWGAYYQFVYTTYPDDTKLPTFSRKLSDKEWIALDQANTILSSCGRNPAAERKGETTEYVKVTIQPGKTATIADIVGKRAITALKVKMQVPPAEQSYDLMRKLVLKMYWDNEEEPSVWTPLGDFFGSAPGVNYYKSLPLGMTVDGFYSYWYMPFARRGRLQLQNDGTEPQTITFLISHAPVKRSVKSLGRFHAKWHRDMFLPEDPARRAIDWTLLKTEGRGRFCGVMLHVWNPKGGWWGEGDEKFFVDGETFPSTIGTGSEDYFGYAWCDPTLFQNCYHNQTISMGNAGHISVNRWHITDNIPFQKSFEGAIEKYYPNQKPTLYACTSYWYQAAGQTDPYPETPVQERTGYWEKPESRRVKGALEGEQMKVLAKSGGDFTIQDVTGFGDNWSNGSHLWWTGAGPGDTLELAIPVATAGKYQLTAQLTQAIDYGIVQLSLDGTALGEPIDLFHDGVVPTGELDLGTHELTAGEHTLQLKITGANDQAVKNYMCGLDYVKLVATE